MQQPATEHGIDLPAIRANLKQLGHDVKEEEIVSMLQDIDINRMLAHLPHMRVTSARKGAADAACVGDPELVTPTQAVAARRRDKVTRSQRSIPEAKEIVEQEDRSWSSGSWAAAAQYRLPSPQDSADDFSTLSRTSAWSEHQPRHLDEYTMRQNSSSSHVTTISGEDDIGSQHGSMLSADDHSDNDTSSMHNDQHSFLRAPIFDAEAAAEDSDEEDDDGYYVPSRTAQLVCTRASTFWPVSSALCC